MSYQHLNAKERHTLMYLLQWNLSYRDWSSFKPASQYHRSRGE